MKDIVIIGAGDFGREVAWLVEDINKAKETFRIIGLLDDDEKKIGQVYNGYKCIGPVSQLIEIRKTRQICAVIAMQDGNIRRHIVEKLCGFNDWETLIHPLANISATSSIGKGSIICAGSSISVNTNIGNHCVFNISSILGHDCEIGDYVSIMSGSCVSGHVMIGEEAYLATNCTVVPGRRIGRNARVGAGSVVLRNVQDGVSVMGVPAKVYKF